MGTCYCVTQSLVHTSNIITIILNVALTFKYTVFIFGCLYVASNHNIVIECLTKKTSISSNHAGEKKKKKVLDSPGSTAALPAILSSSLKS